MVLQYIKVNYITPLKILWKLQQMWIAKEWMTSFMGSEIFSLFLRAWKEKFTKYRYQGYE